MGAPPPCWWWALGRRCFSSSVISRESRAVPFEPREVLLQARKEPRYMSECKGTPRMEYDENMIDGIRLRPTFNPFVKLTRAKRYVLDNWPSRNWADWNPYSCFRGGSDCDRQQQVKEAMKKMDDLVAEYRKEVRDKQRYNWFEKVVHDFAGEQLSSEYLRSRKEPKM
ncbi:hypothetical protein, conserved [Eimeria praecox]|uniref:BIR protein n=1 Tax=Eimeria praecox TaxID=51316 RepID=U6H6E3_9EIME|nr:hypothetical protein, conserved [Eimeria praecox]